MVKNSFSLVYYSHLKTEKRLVMTNTYLRYGLITSLTLIGYFLLMRLFGLHDNPVFSAFNAILYGGGILLAIRTYKRKTTEFVYSEGWLSGFMSGAVATLIFTAFMAVYMYEIDTLFATSVLGNWGITYNNGVFVMLFSMVLMGMSTAMICALTFMQRFKVSLNPTNGMSN